MSEPNKITTYIEESGLIDAMAYSLLVLRQDSPTQFKSGGIVAGTVHQNESIISRKVFGKINVIELP